MLYTNENSNCSSAVSSTRHTFTYTAPSPLPHASLSRLCVFYWIFIRFYGFTAGIYCAPDSRESTTSLSLVVLETCCYFTALS